MGKRLTIYDIKRIHERKTDGKYFTRQNMKFFGQNLKMFSIKKLSETVYRISAPSYWDGRLMGVSKAEFDSTTGELKIL